MRKRKRNKKPLVVIFILILLVFGALYIFKGYFQGNKKKPDEELVEKPKEYEVSFTLAGNVLLNQQMWYDATKDDGYDFTYMFEYLNDIMTKSNINMYTEESIVGGKPLGAAYMTKYNSPSEILKTAKEVGFNVVSLGTYHALDKGKDGIVNSITSLRDNELVYSGITDSEDNRLKNNIIEKNGVKVAFLSYTMASQVLNEENLVSIYSEDLVKSDIEKTNADIIVVAIDWNNYTTNEINDEEKNVVNYLKGLGVNIIVGNNDYSIQPIELTDDTIVCYSLGNLLSGHSYIDNRIGALVDFKVKITELNNNKTKKIDDVNVLFTYAYNSGNVNYKIMPFSKITNELNNYTDYYNKYSELIKNGNDKIKVYPIGGENGNTEQEG